MMGRRVCIPRGWISILAGMIVLIAARGAVAGADQVNLTGVAVWVTSSTGLNGQGGLEELLLDRLGSNGLQDIQEPARVRAAGSFVGFGDGAVFNKAKLRALGNTLGCRWVVWVKVVDRGVDFKKGLSIPHLFIRRKAVSRMLVDARVVDVLTGELAASRRWRLDKSGAGSYQVAEDVRQDPVYNNSAGQFFQDARRLEWQTAQGISCWFKALMARTDNTPVITAEENSLDDGPFVVKEKPGIK